MTPKIAWFKKRHYPHFDKFVSEKNALNIVKDPKRISRHSFMPFISFEVVEPRYKRHEHKNKTKKRMLSCSSHVDSVIYSYYGYKLKDEYERILKERDLSRVVIAYRKLPGKKCNIHFADEVFELIKKRKNCVAIAIDVEKFFDSINHEILKSGWSNLLGVDRLPDDHYAVFKSITKFSRVERAELYKLFNVRGENFKGPYCTPKQFRDLVADKGLIQKNRKDFGIPQGSPISALLSNIYLLELDSFIFGEAKKRNAIYRRYSDDVLMICDEVDFYFFSNLIRNLFEKFRLCLSEEKKYPSLNETNPVT